MYQPLVEMHSCFGKYKLQELDQHIVFGSGLVAALQHARREGSTHFAPVVREVLKEMDERLARSIEVQSNVYLPGIALSYLDKFAESYVAMLHPRAERHPSLMVFADRKLLLSLADHGLHHQKELPALVAGFSNAAIHNMQQLRRSRGPNRNIIQGEYNALRAATDETLFRNPRYRV